MPIVSFEGLPGVGKTTAAQATAELGGGCFVPIFDVLPLEMIRGALARQSQDADARFEHGARQNVRQMHIAQERAECGDLAVLDQSAYGTLAEGRTLRSPKAQLVKEPAPLPDFAYELVLPDNEYLARLWARGHRHGRFVFDDAWGDALFARRCRLRDEYAVFGLTQIYAGVEPQVIARIVLDDIGYNY